MERPGLATQGKQSSVMDRIRWIEKTHGPVSNSAQVGQQRGRLKLPKQFEGQKVTDNSEESSNLNTASSPVTPQVKSEPTRTPRQTLQPLKTTETHQMPSPVLSEAGSMTTTVAVGDNDTNPVTSLKQLQHSGQLLTPRQEPKQPMSDEKVEESANVAHSRTISTESVIEEAIAENTLYGNQCSSSSDIELHDPVPATENKEKVGSVGKEVRGRYPRRSLGGIRSRAPPANSRKYHKFQADDTSSISLHSSHDDHPAEEFRETSPALRSTRSLTNVVSASNSIERNKDDNKVKFAENSLLTRLASLTANRPNVQDLVSNRSSPKFVKRSHHFSSSPVASAALAATNRTNIVWSRSTQKRYK
ncbi:hypothetical protein COEREDRAFT_95254 [Coemansia reversa NRRL 1564]|uniref:Uncharacterized protein n=1 Tax=Coemansia reversa (strain ATCC 12441 / NRRL 1564) TaxID=763665 RepID=A0A2G5BMA4_COERN|nr:hypothetical protein COEREDRAFT_95254 [Coemansia reversa NRRL 1564]|eukprot:PIA19777.1 hypothetical protein COEREDRAFT_95254 [Coemansia reversa NRRL 1564]